MHTVETIIGWTIAALVLIVRELLAFAMAVSDMVGGWGAPQGLAIVAGAIITVFACLVVGHSGPSLLKSVGLWLVWRYILAAQAATDWLIAQIEARRRRKGTYSEWTRRRRTGETHADGATVEDEVPDEPIGEQGQEHEHHLVRALRDSREWEMLNGAASGKTKSKVAYRRLAQRFHPDRAKPQDREAATWCMQEINRIWDNP